MSRDKAVQARKRAIRKRAVFESESELRFYQIVVEPHVCVHAVSLRSYVDKILVYIKCYECGLELR